MPVLSRENMKEQKVMINFGHGIIWCDCIWKYNETPLEVLNEPGLFFRITREGQDRLVNKHSVVSIVSQN